MTDLEMYVTLLVATHHTKPNVCDVRLAIQGILSELRNRAAAREGMTEQEMQDSSERIANVRVLEFGE